MSDDEGMHQMVCSCQSTPVTTNGHSEQAQTVAELHQALSDLIAAVVNDKSFMFPSDQAVIWRAREALRKTAP